MHFGSKKGGVFIPATIVFSGSKILATGRGILLKINSIPLMVGFPKSSHIYKEMVETYELISFSYSCIKSSSFYYALTQNQWGKKIMMKKGKK